MGVYFLNVFLYKYLAHLWNNIAIVPLFHVLMMSVLVAHIFYFLYCRNLVLRLILPFYLLLIFSLPIGLYNTILWKDIPFALLTVYWGYTLVSLYLQRVEGTLRYSKEQIVAFILLLCSMALIRYNGAVYLIVVPVYFIILRLVSTKIVVVMTLTGSIVSAVGFFVLRKVGLISDGGYVFSQGLGFFHKILGKSFSDLWVATWNNYWGIFNVNQTASKWDLWHFYLGDRFAYQFLKDTGWNDVFNFMPSGGHLFPFLRDAAMKFYWKSYEIPYVYMNWNAVFFLGLYMVTIVFFRRYPLTAVFSSFILAQVLSLLVFVDVMNWRYYYFAFFGGYFLVPLMFLDIQRGWQNKAKRRELIDEN